MSLIVNCDHCKLVITGVAYTVEARHADLADSRIRAAAHLHWDCLKLFGRTDTHAVITWDWKESPDPSDLHRALNRLAGLHVEPVDTDSDQYAIVISTQDMSMDDVARIWREHGDAQ